LHGAIHVGYLLLLSISILFVLIESC
jgi:hypothetical protein